MKTVLLSLSAFLTVSLSAATLSAPSTSQLIVYNGNVGLVHEKRALSLSKGPQEIIYDDVASTLNTDSVSIKLPKDVILYSQQYRFDKLNAQKLAQAHIGTRVKFYIKTGSDLLYKEGTLLSASHEAVIKTPNNDIYTVPTSALIFSTIPKSLITKPSLVWNVSAAKKSDSQLELDYLINNISWKSNYVLNLDKKSADLTGWISINNRSGKAFNDVHLHVLAGDLNLANNPQQPRRHYKEVMAVMADAPQVTQVSSEGYHHYSVPFKVSLANNEQTQIKFIDLKNIPITRKFRANLSNPFYFQGNQKHPVQRYVEIKSLETPLPQGVVRSYATSEATTLFVGATAIKHTPKHEKIALLLGNDFDMNVKEVSSKINDDKYHYNRVITYEITNRSEKNQEVELFMPYLSANHHQASIITNEKYEQVEGTKLRFTIKTKADSTYIFDVLYRAKK